MAMGGCSEVSKSQLKRELDSLFHDLYNINFQIKDLNRKGIGRKILKFRTSQTPDTGVSFSKGHRIRDQRSPDQESNKRKVLG